VFYEPVADCFRCRRTAAYLYLWSGLSVRATIGLGRSNETVGVTDLDLTTITFVGRVGYDARIARTVTIWPRVALGYVHDSAESGGSNVSGYSIPLIAEAPVLWEPVRHFFGGIGPVFTRPLASKLMGMDEPKTTVFGV
jgi:hypothetical protein